MKADIQSSLSVNEIRIDTTAPRILNVVKDNSLGTHVGVGAVVDLVAHFNEPVIVIGNPSLTLSIGGTSAVAFYQDTGISTYSETHTFRYTVGEGHNGGIQITGLNLDQDNFIQDQAGHQMEANIQPSLSVGEVNVDTTSPIVSSVTKEKSTGINVGKDAVVDLVARFNEPVMVTGSPSLNLNIGGKKTASAVYQNTGDSTYSETHTFRYTVGEGHNGGIRVTSLDLDQDNFIQDRVGNKMGVNIEPSLSVSGLNVDTIYPSVSSVTKASGTATYVGKDAVVDLIVRFNEPVALTGSPNLTLNIGGRNATSAVYQNTGDSTYSETHTFRHTVVAGHYGDIQVTGLNLDQDNFIQDQAGNKAEVNMQTSLLVSGVTIIVEPGIPRELIAIPGIGEVELSWKAPSTQGASDIIRYEYQYRTIEDTFGSTWTTVPGEGGTLTATVPSLTSGTAYYFRVRAVNTYGGGMSAEINTVPAHPDLAVCASDSTTTDASQVRAQPMIPLFYVHAPI